jgi:hypothetical protein
LLCTLLSLARFDVGLCLELCVSVVVSRLVPGRVTDAFEQLMCHDDVLFYPIHLFFSGGACRLRSRRRPRATAR